MEAVGGLIKGRGREVCFVIRDAYLAFSRRFQLGSEEMRKAFNQVLAIYGQWLQKLFCSLLDCPQR